MSEGQIQPYSAEEIMIRLRKIEEQHEAALDAAQKASEVSISLLQEAVIIGLDGDEQKELRGDVSALHSSLSGLIAARRTAYEHPGGEDNYIGPISRPDMCTIEHFAGGLLIAAKAWDRTILGQVSGVDFRVEPGSTRVEAAEGYYVGHEMARGFRPAQAN